MQRLRNGAVNDSNATNMRKAMKNSTEPNRYTPKI